MVRKKGICRHLSRTKKQYVASSLCSLQHLPHPPYRTPPPVWQDIGPSSRGMHRQMLNRSPGQTSSTWPPGADDNDRNWHRATACLVVEVSWFKKLKLICKGKQY